MDDLQGGLDRINRLDRPHLDAPAVIRHPDKLLVEH